MLYKGQVMSNAAVQLAEGFYPQDLQPWYDGAAVGEMITIALPSRATNVRLIKRSRHQVSWWPAGGRGMTMPLADARSRLDMLRDTRLR